MEKIIFEKKFIVKKGQDDWRVWGRASDYLFNFMEKKRKNHNRIRKLRKPLTIKIEVTE